MRSAAIMAGLVQASLALLFVGPVRAEQATPSMEQPAIEELGNGRYRVGAIEIDKPARRFQVSGTVIQREMPDGPIEFIAVTKGGMKAYEAIFELDTTAVEFNLACILIGLDAEGATLPERHFDPVPVKGERVSVFVEWRQQGESSRVPVEQSITGHDPQEHEWVYTGSFFGHAGHYMAEVSGALVGFVHDQDSIIQHRTGLGLGNYGAITYNSELLPVPGTAVTLVVEAAGTE